MFDKAVESEPSQKILDSGKRTEFPGGAVRDIQEDKGRCDLMPLDIVAMVVSKDVDGVLSSVAEFMESRDIQDLVRALWAFAQDTNTTVYDLMLAVSMHYKNGAGKYGERNWEKGIPIHSYIDSAVRHYLKFRNGNLDEPHACAFVWNIMNAAWTCIHRHDLYNDFVDAVKVLDETAEDS